jgi:hypothetical protein
MIITDAKVKTAITNDLLNDYRNVLADKHS